MKTTRQIFDTQQPKVTVCATGRAMVALNEEVITTTEQVQTGIDKKGNPIYEEQERTQYAYDVTWIDSVGGDTEQAVLASAKTQVISDITAYDSSSAVNSFALNGASVWLDKATRVGLMNSTTIAKGMGSETTTLWLGEVKLEVDCDKAIQLLSALEMYALDCFNITAAHKKAVNEMESIEEVLSYDYKTGYPSKLEMAV